MAPSQEYTPLWKRPIVAILALPLLAVLLNWPYLMGGFSGDDFIFLNLLNDDNFSFSRWRGLWSISDYPFMDNLWWKDWKSTGSSGIFWRPVPSLVFEGSLKLFGQSAFPLHLLSILLHAGTSLALYLSVRKLSSSHGLAFLAGLFFVTCEDHSMQIGWIATFSDLLAVFFIMLALLAHIHWLTKRKATYLLPALAALVLSLGCKESAVAAPLAIILLSYLMPLGRAEDKATRSTFIKNIRHLLKNPVTWLPALLVLVAYLIIYKSMQMGSLNTLMYVDPLTAPLKYLSHLTQHLPVLWLGTFSIIPPYLILFEPGLLIPLAILGIIFFAVWVVALIPLRYNSLILWAFVFYLAALLPQLSADASERGLYFSMIPAAVLLAAVTVTIKPIASRITSLSLKNWRWTRIAGWFAVIGILIPGTFLSALSPWSFLSGFNKPVEELRTVIPHIERFRPQHVILLNTSGFMLSIYTWDIINYFSDKRQDVWTLSSANGKFSLEKTGDSSFVIRTDHSGWLDNIFARIFRTRAELQPGGRYETVLFSATLSEMTKSGRDVLAVWFDFREPLDKEGFLFLRWDGAKYSPLDIAALKVGEKVTLADTSDLWKALN